MVFDLLGDELVLLVILWLGMVLLAYCWRNNRPAASLTIPTPDRPPRKRTREPTPFAGFIHPPHCEACEQAAQVTPVSQPPAAPPPILSTRGRRRVIDTSSHFCPQPRCAYWGRVGLGNLRANGHPSGRAWRQLQCTACGSFFVETHGTLFHGLAAACCR